MTPAIRERRRRLLVLLTLATANRRPLTLRAMAQGAGSTLATVGQDLLWLRNEGLVLHTDGEGGGGKHGAAWRTKAIMAKEEKP